MKKSFYKREKKTSLFQSLSKVPQSGVEQLHQRSQRNVHGQKAAVPQQTS